MAAAPRRSARALAGAICLCACVGLLRAACGFLPGPQAAPAPAPTAPHLVNPAAVASAALPVVMLAEDAEAKYGDYRRWSSVLLPLTTLVVPAVGFGAFVLYLFTDEFAFNFIPGSKESERRKALWDAHPTTAQENPMDGLINPDDYEKGLEEAWERAKPKGSTVTVKDKLKQWSTQNNPHWYGNKLSA